MFQHKFQTMSCMALTYNLCWECIVISYGRNSLAKSLLGSIVLADMANAPCLWQESISDSVEDAPMVSWYTAL